MALTKKPSKKDVNNFIENTSDIKNSSNKKRVQFTHTIDPNVLEKIDLKASFGSKVEVWLAPR